jgi:hypothetical protein
VGGTFVCESGHLHARRSLVAMVRAGLFDTPPTGDITTPVTSDATGRYYTGTSMSGSPVLTRTDPMMNFV